MAQHLSGPPNLAGQVAFITGGAGGMGRAIAKVFKAAGAKVIATDRAEKEEFDAGIEYRHVVRVMNRLQDRGFTKIGFVAEDRRR